MSIHPLEVEKRGNRISRGSTFAEVESQRKSGERIVAVMHKNSGAAPVVITDQFEYDEARKGLFELYIVGPDVPTCN